VEYLIGIDHLEFDASRSGLGRRVHKFPRLYAVRPMACTKFRDDQGVFGRINRSVYGKALSHIPSRAAIRLTGGKFKQWKYNRLAFYGIYQIS
jgi:hypothetical protein